MTNLGGGELRVGGWTLEHAACGGHLGFEFDCFPKTNQGQLSVIGLLRRAPTSSLMLPWTGLAETLFAVVRLSRI